MIEIALKEWEFYFAYGSNLFQKQIEKRCPSAHFRTIACYPHYKLAFTKPSKRKDRIGSWVADMIFAPGQTVWGIVYSMTKEDILLLDEQEVTYLDDGYLRQKIVVFDSYGRENTAWTYFVKVKRGDGTPHPEYMKKIVNGAQQFELPDEYIKYLKTIKVTEV